MSEIRKVTMVTLEVAIDGEVTKEDIEKQLPKVRAAFAGPGQKYAPSVWIEKHTCQEMTVVRR